MLWIRQGWSMGKRCVSVTEYSGTNMVARCTLMKWIFTWIIMSMILSFGLSVQFEMVVFAHLHHRLLRWAYSMQASVMQLLSVVTNISECFLWTFVLNRIHHVPTLLSMSTVRTVHKNISEASRPNCIIFHRQYQDGRITLLCLRVHPLDTRYDMAANNCHRLIMGNVL